MLARPAPLIGPSSTADMNPVTACATTSAASRLSQAAPPICRREAHLRTGYWLFIGACSALIVAVRLCDLFHPFSGDSANFIYMGKLVSEGGRIGVELIDNKFPTVGLMTSLGWRTFGACWPEYVLVQVAITGLAALLLGRSARHHLGASAAVPAALFAAVYLNFGIASQGFQLETVQASFAIVAASAALGALRTDDARDSLLVGLAAGTGAMLKPSGLAVLAAFAGATLVQRRHQPSRVMAHAAAELAGLIVPTLVTLIYFRQTDLLHQIPPICRQIAQYAAGSKWQWSDLAHWIIVLALLAFPMIVLGVVFRPPRHRVPADVDLPGAERRAGASWFFHADPVATFDPSWRTGCKPVPQAALIFCLLWFAIEAGGIVAQGRMYPYHFLVMAGPAALLFAMVSRRDDVLPLAAAIVPPLVLSVCGAIMLLGDAHPPLERLKTSDYLSAHAGASDAVWQDGMARLLLETGLPAGSRFPMTFLWVNHDDAPRKYCREMLEDFEQRRPRYIILPADLDAHVREMSQQIKELRLDPHRKVNFNAAWGELGSYVRRNYVPEARIGRSTVWRRVAPPSIASRSIPASAWSSRTTGL